MSERSDGPQRGPRRSAAAPMRAVVGRVRVMGTSRWRPPLGQTRKAPRLIAVGAATAGAGKSVVASNLAVAIAGLGPQVVLVDLDLAEPRQHDLFNITRPVPGLQAWLDREVASLDTSLTSTGIRNLHLVTGARAPANRLIDPEQRDALVQQLYALDGDVVIVDVGTTNRDDLLDFFSTGALRLLVTGPDRASLESTFGFLKGAAMRATDRYGARTLQALAHFRGRLIGNRAGAPEETESFHAFSRMVHDHLALPLPVLGCLRGSDRIVQSVAARRPLLARRGLDENVRAFHAMAENLMVEGAVSSEVCDLGSDVPIATSRVALPAELSSYLRKHTRYPVDWTARLEFRDHVTEVRVLDVSFSGAAIEVFADVAAGDEAVLRLHQFPGQPALRVVIRNVRPGVRRVGLVFLDPGDVSSRLVAAASALAGAGGRRDDPNASSA
jgi:MinD-like ATPase involved in chromosome partitioning or flagellar assembly